MANSLFAKKKCMKIGICFAVILLCLFSLIACSDSGDSETDTTATFTESDSGVISEEPQSDETTTSHETEAEPAMELRAGFAREVITPTGEFPLGGAGHQNRYTSEVLEDITVSCIALDDGSSTVLLFTVDFQEAAASYVPSVVAAVSTATQVPRDSIFVSTTHTHSSVTVAYDWDGRQKYLDGVILKFIVAAKAAIADLSPTEVYAGGVETEGLAFVRHYKMKDGSYYGSNFGNRSAGIVDHVREADNELQLVKFERGAEGKNDILLMSFPAHTNANMNFKQLSTDYPGITRDFIETYTDCLVAFFIGAAGDQNPTSRIEGKSYSSDYKEYGKKLGLYAMDALDTLEKREKDNIAIGALTYTANTNKKNLDRYDDALAVKNLAKTHGYQSAEVVALWKEYGFGSYYEANSIIQRSRLGDTLDITISAFSIGDIAFIFAPYEMFSCHGSYIKENSPNEFTFIAACANGDNGYLASSEAFEYNSYEAAICRFEQGTGEILCDKYLEMLREMATRE